METDSSSGRVVHLPRRTVTLAHTTDTAQAPSLTDLLCEVPADPSAMGFLLASLPQGRAPILWVQDHASRRENGCIYMPGLPAFGVDRPVVQVRVSHPRDVLWAMEQGAACAGLSAVVGEIHGAPDVLSFTATKRLALRSDASGVPVYLLRSGDPGTLSAARLRWRITSLPSPAHRHDARAPGTPRWDADLFRARGRTPGHWIASYDPDVATTTDRLSLVSRTDGGTLDAGDQPIPERAEA